MEECICTTGRLAAAAAVAVDRARIHSQRHLNIYLFLIRVAFRNVDHPVCSSVYRMLIRTYSNVYTIHVIVVHTRQRCGRQSIITSMRDVNVLVHVHTHTHEIHIMLINNWKEWRVCVCVFRSIQRVCVCVEKAFSSGLQRMFIPLLNESARTTPSFEPNVDAIPINVCNSHAYDMLTMTSISSSSMAYGIYGPNRSNIIRDDEDFLHDIEKQRSVDCWWR